MAAPIHFYNPNEPFGYLSNFAPYPITIGDQVWASTEHYYQAQKFTDPALRQGIQLASTPYQAFKLSRQYQHAVRENWLAIRDQVMYDAVMAKFSQHPKLLHWLVSTDSCDLVEHSHNDSYWGDGGACQGCNRLGHILMKVRAQFADQEPYNLVHYIEHALLPTKWGVFTMHAFVEPASGQEHLALVYGELDTSEPVLIRLHSECLTGDALFSMRCDCGFQLEKALDTIVSNGSGVLLYLRQEGRGIGLVNKVRAYRLQDQGADTVEANERLGFSADMRDYRFCRGILSFLGIEQVKLMTNNPRKIKALEVAGIQVAQRVPIQEGKNPDNLKYLKTKASKLGHMFDDHHLQHL